jgi:signal transduction histidine kinase
MADASHELRTPVSIARTAAQVTLSNPRAEVEYRDSLEVINAQMRRLTHVVDDMFMLALADLDARPLERSELYLNETVADCVRSARVLALPRGVQIDLAGDDVDISTRGDEGLLRQLVMNLLDNGIRHAESGGRVRVALRRDVHIAELSVEDTGAGIPAAEQDRVFERFVRLGRAGGGGGGLGLAIARWIAEQHGGRLRVDGAGASSSRFVLTLPV